MDLIQDSNNITRMLLRIEDKIKENKIIMRTLTKGYKIILKDGTNIQLRNIDRIVDEISNSIDWINTARSNDLAKPVTLDDIVIRYRRDRRYSQLAVFYLCKYKDYNAIRLMFYIRV